MKNLIFGILKWYNEEKGYGVVVSAQGAINEVFLHVTQWKDKYRSSPLKEIPLIFTTSIQRNKVSAVDCQFFNFNDSEQWRQLLNLYGKSEIVVIDFKKFDLIELVFNNIPEKFNLANIENELDTFINKISDNKLFNKTGLINKIVTASNHEELKTYFHKKILSRILSLSEKQQMDLFLNQAIPGFIPSIGILLNYCNLIDERTIIQIEDSNTQNDIISNILLKLEQEFDIHKYREFDKYLTLIKTYELKTLAIEKLNGDIGQNYKNHIIDYLKDKLTSKSIEFLTLISFINNHPSFILPEILEKWMIEFAEIIIKYGSVDIVFRLRENNIKLDFDKFILNNLENLEIKHIQMLFDKNMTNGLEREIFDIQVKKGNYEFVLMYAKRLLPAFHNHYDGVINGKIEPSLYFEFWKRGYGDILPSKFLNKYFDSKHEKYIEIDTWIKEGIIQKDEMLKVLMDIILSIDEIKNRNDFYTKLNCIKKHVELSDKNVSDILGLNDRFNEIILWHLGLFDDFDLKMLSSKFIYFAPDDQVYIFKRLFYLKHTKKVDFTFGDLDRIVRADLSAFLDNEQFKNDFILDISTHVIIEAIKNYVGKGNFLFESDLILKDLRNNSRRKFKIDKYFAKCTGRMTAQWNWDTEGKIRKVRYPDNKELFYWGIEIPSGIERIAKGKYENYTYMERNPNLDYLKEEVKKLPGAKWNAPLKIWGVLSKYQKEVYNFAAQNRFFIELEDKNHYTNNIHLVEFSRNTKSGSPNIPLGIQFCEGRKSKLPDKKLNKEFWWCVNESCFQNEEVEHLSCDFHNSGAQSKKIWEYYTLLDLLHILNINTDEHKTNPVDLVPQGHYYKFVGHINAFNRLLEKLYCKECGELLFPVRTSHFALYRDVHFHCENKNCRLWHKDIYLNHCLNGECSNIVDSRVSKKCSLKLYICDICGTCCSIDMFKRRYENLKLLGGYIHPELIENVENKNGHLERAEYYCFNCGDKMVRQDKTLFGCVRCNVQYDLMKYKWLERKWTLDNYKHVVRIKLENNEEDMYDINDMPF